MQTVTMVKLYIFSLQIFYMFAFLDSESAYGPFLVVLKKFQFCKGPKVKDCTIATSRLYNATSISVGFLVKENVIPTKAKVIASSASSADAIRLLFNKPCTNLFMKQILQMLFKVSRKCEIPKGDYKFNLDFQEMVDRYYGGKYFYGAWQFQSYFYNNDCNFVCTESELHFVPKPAKA